MKTAVVSLNFSPGHIAHIKAYSKLFQCLEDDVKLFLASEYEHYMSGISSVEYVRDVYRIIDWKPDLVFIYNISIANIKLAKLCKSKSIHTVYVLHEPRDSFNELLKEGHNLLKSIGASAVNSMICREVNKVLLASQKGKLNYEKYMKGCNDNYDLFPLIFLDEYDESADFSRLYFSYIGEFTESHGCTEFLQFIKYAIEKSLDIRFLIATKNDISHHLERKVFQDAMRSNKLFIQSGQPMTTEEINKFYRQSICIWNAYNRSTQSGVLPNALMQGTPVIVNNNGVAKEIMKDKSAGCFIEIPPKNEEIYQAYLYVKEHLPRMEKKAREVFLSQYFYKSNIDLAKRAILTCE